MKVNEKNIEDLNKYKYFVGSNDEGLPTWSNDLNEATLIVKDEVGIGEMSDVPENLARSGSIAISMTNIFMMH